MLLALHIEAAECNGGKCLEVLAAAGCIALAIAKRSVPSLLGCVSGATDKVSLQGQKAKKNGHNANSAVAVRLCWLHRSSWRLPRRAEGLLSGSKWAMKSYHDGLLNRW